jgi:hypothetical protein
VLSGEIVHHLRSCLDHVIWHFSSPSYRRECENAIEFPVYRKQPLTKEKLAGYDRKIKGVTNPNVLSLVGKLQPYKRGSDAVDDPISIVHDMDRFDKHRELAIVVSCANMTFRAGTSVQSIHAIMKHRKGEGLTSTEFAMAQKAIKNDAKVSPQVAFPQFGKRKDYFVAPALSQLHEAIVDRIDLFASEV